MLREDELVRVAVEEAGTALNGSMGSLLFLLQRGGFPTSFRFQLQPFLGVRSSEAEGLVESIRFNLRVGNNGLAAGAAPTWRRRIRKLVREIPPPDDNVKLLAAAAFLVSSGWAKNGRTVETMLSRVKPEICPAATLESHEALGWLAEHGLIPEAD
jgi:hypothetical protein